MKCENLKFDITKQTHNTLVSREESDKTRVWLTQATIIDLNRTQYLEKDTNEQDTTQELRKTSKSTLSLSLSPLSVFENFYSNILYFCVKYRRDKVSNFGNIINKVYSYTIIKTAIVLVTCGTVIKLNYSKFEHHDIFGCRNILKLYISMKYEEYTLLWLIWFSNKCQISLSFLWMTITYI